MIMKKTYMKPSVEVVEIEAAEVMLDVSNGLEIGKNGVDGKDAYVKDGDIDAGFVGIW